MSREPDRRQITTTAGSSLQLGMSLEEIEASEVQILFDGQLQETRDISTNSSEIKVVLTLHNEGVYCIELVAEGGLPEEMERLQQQDALEFSPLKAHAMWDVTVEETKQQSDIWQVWRIITHLLAFREAVSIVRNRWGRVRARLGWSDMGDDVDEEEMNMTLDEFQEE